MSCLFRALSYFHEGVSTAQMRDTICHHLSQNPILGGASAADMISWETGMQLGQYINRMRSSTEWGGAIELKAYCDIFRRNVRMYSQPNRKEIEFLAEKKQSPWVSIHWTGNHYEPMRQEERPRPSPSQPLQRNKHIDHSARPQSYPARPQSYSARPQNYSARPQNYSAGQQNYSARQQNYSARPQGFSHAKRTRFQFAPVNHSTCPCAHCVHQYS